MHAAKRVSLSSMSSRKSDDNHICVICYTPARAFVKQVKGHTGYYGCDKCTQKGMWEGKTTFPEMNSPLHTDAHLDEMVQSSHHVGNS